MTVLARLRAAPLLPILLLAFALRIAVTWGASIHHPDEVFQYLEQAHRIVFGYGVVPWEYRFGMRSWLVPGLLAGPMALGRWIAPDTLAYLVFPRLAVTIATLMIVWSGWVLGRGIARTHAILAAFVAAIWFEQVFYAAHTLTETIATSAALPGLALLILPGRRRRIAVAGALLAFAALVRFHYAPALALAAVWQCRLDVRTRWLPLLAGALPVLLLSGMVDLIAGTVPFAWIVENVRQNIVNDAASNYGVSDWSYYLRAIREWWLWAAVPVAALAVFGAARYPVLLAVAVGNIAIHMMIGHKEERFILLSSTLLVILAAIGTADLLAQTRDKWRIPLTIAAFAAWSIASIALATATPMRFRWSGQAPVIEAAAIAGRVPGVCGVATWHMLYWQSGGYTVLHRNVPIYPMSAQVELRVPPADRATLAAVSPAYNTIVTSADGVADIPAKYRLVACRTTPASLTSAAERAALTVCTFARKGGCDPAIAAAWQLH